MSDDNNEDKSGGIGIVGGTAAVVGGVGAVAGTALHDNASKVGKFNKDAQKYIKEGIDAAKKDAEKAFERANGKLPNQDKAIKGLKDGIEKTEKKIADLEGKIEKAAEAGHSTKKLTTAKKGLESSLKADQKALAKTESGVEAAVEKWTKNKATAIEKGVEAAEKKVTGGSLIDTKSVIKKAEDAAKAAKKPASEVRAAGKEAVKVAEEAAEKHFATAKNVKNASWIKKPLVAFKGMSGGKKAVAVGLGVVAAGGIGLLASRMGGGSHVERLEAERNNSGPAPSRA